MDAKFELLSKLSHAFGPTGCEYEVKDIIKEEIEGLADEIYTDRLGNLIAVVRGKGEGRLMLAAHTDEVGFMITNIDDDGTLRIDAVGIDPRVMCGRQVVVGNDPRNGAKEKTRVYGIVGSKPIHLQGGDEGSRANKIEDLYIDIGATDRGDAEKYVQPGDYGTFVTEFKELEGGLIMGKAIDDRFGCAVMVETIKWLRSEKVTPPCDVYFAFTVREENGLSGARVAAFEINPTKAIVLEATAVADIAEVPDSMRVAELGKGGAISLMDRATIYSTELVNHAFEVAKKYGIKCQPKRYVSGGTDAGVIHRTREGVPTLGISAPCRYIHSATSVFHRDDYDSVCQLVRHLITE
ncbi:MAG TPA: M42 family metallopeptidase [Bacillota bacterium]|nr:M42 family metallopeptidase [Bacillota bacterium]